MGNSVLDGRSPADRSGGAISKFYTSAAWIEGRAEQQLEDVARWTGVQRVAAFPDLHPGKYGPVGCAVLADRIFPQLIGNDIGCGMALFKLDLPQRKFKMEKALRRLRALDEPFEGDQNEILEAHGLSPELFASSLGTIGGGNHFCEVQSLAATEPSCGLDISRLYLLVHSGSRGLGSAVFANVYQSAGLGLPSESDAAKRYVEAHDEALSWAVLNRYVIAQRAANALRTDAKLIVDSPHNMLEKLDDGWLHRKGAASIGEGLVPLAGSRASPSFLMLALGHTDALNSLAHGAGRRYDRASMHGRVRAKKSDVEAMQRNTFGGRIICEDRDLLVEEAPLAYKDARSVVADLETCRAAKQVAEFHPLVTFKKTRVVRP